jgi:ADP-L-glycero-D-manno-heptose 6-epimerase
MKIMVTGHKGFIGSNMYKKLVELGHEVTGFEWGEEFPGYDYDVIIHMGAISSTVERDIDKVMRQNYDFSVWLVETCNRFGIHLQYSSSASVYGLNKEFKEDSPVDPRTPYAWSKYMFERYVQNKYWGITVQGFRYFNVYGPGEDHKGDQASPYHKFSQQVKNGNCINLFTGSDRQFRDFVPVEHVIDTHLKFLDVKESGIWNVGTGKAKSFLDVANEVKNDSTELRFFPMPEHLQASYQYYTCSDNTKIRKTLT